MHFSVMMCYWIKARFVLKAFYISRVNSSVFMTEKMSADFSTFCWKCRFWKQTAVKLWAEFHWMPPVVHQNCSAEAKLVQITETGSGTGNISAEFQQQSRSAETPSRVHLASSLLCWRFNVSSSSWLSSSDPPTDPVRLRRLPCRCPMAAPSTPRRAETPRFSWGRTPVSLVGLFTWQS